MGTKASEPLNQIESERRRRWRVANGMRSAGCSYEAIGESLGVSKHTAARYVRNAWMRSFYRYVRDKHCTALTQMRRLAIHHQVRQEELRAKEQIIPATALYEWM